MKDERRPRAKGSRQQAVERKTPRCSGFASTVLVVVLLVAAADLAYSTSFAGVFVFDDEYAIQRNPHIRTLWPLTEAMSAPPESPVSVRPIASLTLALNYALARPDVRDAMVPGGPGAPPDGQMRFLANVWGYHFMNLALHLLAGLALVGVVRRTLLSDRLRARFAGVATPLAFVTSLVWLVHPLTTDAVTYITQRTEVLMGLFYLLALYCSIRALGDSPKVRESESPQVRPSAGAFGASSSRSTRWFWLIAAVASCALGMGSKQTMATAPFVVLAWDWLFASPHPHQGRASSAPAASGAPRLRWALYAALAATWSILIVGLALERWPHSIGMDREGWTPWTYLLTQTGVIAHYLRLSFVPAPLVLDYDGWRMAHSLLDVAPYAALVAALVGLTVFGLVRRYAWSFAGAWFLALLAPSSSILPLATEIAAERRMYTALPAVVALVVIGVYLAGRAALARLVAEPSRRRTVATAVAIVGVGSLVAGFAEMTSARNRDFWSEERIWGDAVEKRPDNPRARMNYGVQLSIARRLPEAEAQLRESLRLKEPVAKAHLNLGSILCSLGRFDEGVPHLERAIALDPESGTAYGNLGEAYGALGRRADAAKYFALAVKQEPDKVFLLNRLGWLLATSPEDEIRDGAKAVQVGERAVRLTEREDPMSLDTLAAAYAEAGRFGEAAAAEREAVDVATRMGRPDPALTARLSLYQAGQKYREPR